MLKRIVALALLGPVFMLAQGAEPAGKLTAEAIIKHTIESKMAGIKVESVAKTPYLGLYEVRLGGEILYTDEKMTYIFSGNIIDAKTMQNITEKRLRDLSAIKWEDLPLEGAFKTVRGNGKRMLAIFSDPNCPYCKRFEKDLAKVDDVTIYTFLYPILSQDSHEKSKAIWCSADKSKAWSELMLSGTVPTAGSCDTPIESNLALGHKYRVNGTPTLIFANGERVPGAISAEQIEKQFAQNAK
jgi:thiol:disulfide interchange protein DsbC